MWIWQVRGGTLNIRTRPHDGEGKTLWSESSGETNHGGLEGPRELQWERGYLQLPHGYYRVVVEATSGTSTAQALNIAIDDVNIGKCKKGTSSLYF